MAGEWEVRTDGAARGNPGPAGIGVVLTDPSGAVVDELAAGIGWATNNVAEYQALIEALKLARSHGVDRLAVFSDSTLMVEQMRGNYKVKHEGLKPLHAAARKLAGEFERVRYEAVPRGRNKRADELANIGVDRDNPEARPPPSARSGQGSPRLF
jgi:ribonuclease HI